MTEPVCQAAIDLVKHFEGLYLQAYLCPAGVPTIGYGHTAGVKLGQKITAEQAEDLLAIDLKNAAAVVDRLVKVPVTKGQRGALSSFVFNLGQGNFQSSTLLRLLNVGDYEGAAGQFERWVFATVNGKATRMPGLVKRRAAEALLFRHNVFPIKLAAADPMPQAVDDPDGESLQDSAIA
ncbi:lysozyme [Azospirillum sp. Sh1]|uniref:lysozyme n=1 Tax=Azospirillum sp. Sh1 TaxID=2607285 RepID=UPI0011EF629A|nr:lysozyme [Azospirillum sp. Sh1]KAA0573374.1 lysozyme [Azospirillum sp. Sh1]